MKSIKKPAATKGFTLVELVITIAILGILSALAIPSYREYIRRGQKSEAVTNLTQMGLLIEQHRSLYGTYCLSGCSGGNETYTYSESDAGVAAVGNTMGPGKNYLSGFRPKQATTGVAVVYTYTAVVNNDTYDLTATPVASRNAPDETLALDEEGVKSETVGSTVTYGW